MNPFARKRLILAHHAHALPEPKTTLTLRRGRSGPEVVVKVWRIHEMHPAAPPRGFAQALSDVSGIPLIDETLKR